MKILLQWNYIFINQNIQLIKINNNKESGQREVNAQHSTLSFKNRYF